MTHQDHDYIIQHANSLLQNLAGGAKYSKKDHVYTFKRAIQEHLSSCQNFAQATDESARPRQHDSKCKLRAFKLLPKPCTWTRRGKTTPRFTSFNNAKPWALAKALLRKRMMQREQMSQQDHGDIIPFKLQSRALKLLPKPDSGNEEPTRPRLQHSNMQMKSSSSCKILHGEDESTRPRHNIKHANQKLQALAKSLARVASESRD